MTIYIAEISNHHEGCMDKARLLIQAAYLSGAHLVKGQAFKADDMQFAGTMPMEFYKKCEFTIKEYKELIDFGKNLGIFVFFSIISQEFKDLEKYQTHKKLYAKRSSYCGRNELSYYDSDNSFISLSDVRLDFRSFKKANLLFATKYEEEMNCHQYAYLNSFYKRDIGISLNTNDHKGLDDILSVYNVPVIEKHFYLGDEIVWDDKVYRDCRISYEPKEFRGLIDHVNSKQN